MMKKVKLFSGFIVLIAACVSPQKGEKAVLGTYDQVENDRIKLIFSPGRFAFIDPYKYDLALYSCCDTITYGSWKREGKLIVMSTPELNVSEVSMKVTEERESEKNDTVYFYISGPIEEFFKKFEVKKSMRDIRYRVSIKAKNSSFFARSSGTTFDSNVIKFSKPPDAEIEEFRIGIYPTGNFSGRSIGTKSVWTEVYKAHNPKANVFRVHIPNGSYEFMSYIRLERDFIRIINKDKLEWDGNFYIRRRNE